MTQNGQPNPAAPGLQLNGGAAIVAPVSMFPQGVPGNALVVLPLSEPKEELVALLQKGPAAITPEQMWEMLGFNGPAVQVQDDQGRPIAIGLNDLLSGLEKHYQEDPEDINRGRMYAQELLKHQQLEKAEEILKHVVKKGDLQGDDWLALGVTQLNLEKLEDAEATLKGAQKLMKDNPYPTLHLAKVYEAKEDAAAQKDATLKAIEIAPNSVDGWGYLFTQMLSNENEDAAVKTVSELADKPANAKTAAPFIAVQGFYAAEGEHHDWDKALVWATKAVNRNADDPMSLLCLSALHGQKGDMKKVIEVLQPHERKMLQDVRLANNYFQALFQDKQIDKVTRLLNALAGSQDQEVKQFAIEQSKQVSQWLQQQAQVLNSSS